MERLQQDIIRKITILRSVMLSAINLCWLESLNTLTDNSFLAIRQLLTLAFFLKSCCWIL